MRGNLRGMAISGVLAVAGTLGLGLSAARACDHGPALRFGPATASASASEWGYGEVRTTVRFGGLPDYDHCPVCQPRLFVPPPCPPPPCGDEFAAAREYRRVDYREYRGRDLPVAYPVAPVPYPSPQATTIYEAPNTLATPALPTKQAPSLYGTPRYSDPGSVSPPPYATPQARGPYSPPAPSANDEQPPPLPSPYGAPQR